MNPKLADFGLGRLCTNNYYTQKQKYGIPFRSTAPEAFKKHRFSSKSDVWSFGILAWEIVHNGEELYPGMDANQLIKFLSAGNRLEIVEQCPQEIKKLMLDCWKEDPDERPTFAELCILLESLVPKPYQERSSLLLTDNGQEGYLDAPPFEVTEDYHV